MRRQVAKESATLCVPVCLSLDRDGLAPILGSNAVDVNICCRLARCNRYYQMLSATETDDFILQPKVGTGPYYNG
jgi:hypothetical protein